MIQSILARLLTTFEVHGPRGIVLTPNLLQAGAIVVLLFFLVYTLGHLRHTYLDWSIKGIAPGFTFGFVAAIIIEGLFIVGGKTVFTQLIGWKDAPKPISVVLDAGRSKLVDVLGVSSDIPSSKASVIYTSQEVISSIKSLSSSERDLVKNFVCK